MSVLKHFAAQMKPDEWYTCYDLEPYGGKGYPPQIAVSTNLSHLYADNPTKIRRRTHVKRPGETDHIKFEYSLTPEAYLQVQSNGFRTVTEDDLSSPPAGPEQPMSVRRVQKHSKNSGFRTWIQELEDLPKGFEVVIRRT